MEASQMNFIASFLLISLLMTVGYSILIMLGGKKIFKKASQKEITAFYPILNLFTMLEITDTSIYLGILFFIPVLNVLANSIMLYRLGKVFNTGFMYQVGLVLMPIIFYPLLAYGNKQYKVNDEKFFNSMRSMKEENINLMTQEELDNMYKNLPPEEETSKVDSIFKGNIATEEKVEPYRAVKIDVLGLEKLQNDKNNERISANVERLKDKQFILKDISEKSEVKKEENKKENVEYIDL